MIKEVKYLDIFFKDLESFIKNRSINQIENLVFEVFNNILSIHTNLVVKEKIKPLIRLTINENVINKNERIYSVSQLKYPPEKYVKKYGRCNIPNQSIFYGTIHELIAINELKPKKGQIITITTWELKEDEELIYCPIFLKQPNNALIKNQETKNFESMYEQHIKALHKEQQIINKKILEFITERFSATVDNKYHYNYIFSAIYSNYMLNKFQDGYIDAIYYPGIKNDFCFENYAIKPTSLENKFKLTNIEERLVENFNPYVADITGETKHVNNDHIIWY